MEVEALKRPLSIDQLRDGHVYLRPATSLVQTNLFLKVGQMDELFIKVPSELGLEDYWTYAKKAFPDPQDMRAVEESERFERLESTLETLSALKPLTPIGKELVHYLALHKLQHDRLKTQTAVGIPEARFGVLRSTRLRIFYRYEPAMFQARVCGNTLWDMFDFSAFRVAPQWRRFLPAISAQLSALIDSRMLNHIDWNIKNFVFEETAERVFYVDMKPTTLLASQTNEQNLRSIRDYFIA